MAMCRAGPPAACVGACGLMSLKATSGRPRRRSRRDLALDDLAEQTVAHRSPPCAGPRAAAGCPAGRALICESTSPARDAIAAQAAVLIRRRIQQSSTAARRKHDPRAVSTAAGGRIASRRSPPNSATAGSWSPHLRLQPGLHPPRHVRRIRRRSGRPVRRSGSSRSPLHEARSARSTPCRAALRRATASASRRDVGARRPARAAARARARPRRSRCRCRRRRRRRRRRGPEAASSAAFDDQLGLRPRNQHVGRDLELQAPELAVADDVGDGSRVTRRRDQRLVARRRSRRAAAGARRVRSCARSQPSTCRASDLGVERRPRPGDAGGDAAAAARRRPGRGSRHAARRRCSLSFSDWK